MSEIPQDPTNPKAPEPDPGGEPEVPTPTPAEPPAEVPAEPSATPVPDLGPGNVPEPVSPQKPVIRLNPSLKAFSKSCLDIVAIAANELNGLSDSKEPEQALQGLMRAFDKLALRCQRESILISEAKKPRMINPLVEITGINVAKALENTARDLRNGAGIPSTYEETADVLKGQTKIVQALEMIIKQSGVAATVVLPGNPLTDEAGKPLVP